MSENPEYFKLTSEMEESYEDFFETDDLLGKLVQSNDLSEIQKEIEAACKKGRRILVDEYYQELWDWIAENKQRLELTYSSGVDRAACCSTGPEEYEFDQWEGRFGAVITIRCNPESGMKKGESLEDCLRRFYPEQYSK
jgi:hypothetical protein